MRALPDMPAFVGDICFSGGARGADLAWGRAACCLGHRVMHFSFAAHKTRARRRERVMLDDAALRLADPYLGVANVRLKRRWPPRTEYAANLLRRDWYEVKDAARVYAVASRDAAGAIEGGTAWAVTLFLLRHEFGLCPAFLFDQEQRHWLRWDGVWEPIETPPIPSGAWAGIGTRDLTRAGRKAIRDLCAAARRSSAIA
jgi:hypothetical protein